MRNISIAVILFFCFSVRSADYVSHPLTMALLVCSLIPTASGAIELTDEWCFANTNAQTVLGAVGLLAMACNFWAGRIFYRKSQNKLKEILQNRVDSLEAHDKRLKDYDEQINICFNQLKEHIKNKPRKKSSRARARALPALPESDPPGQEP